MSLLVFLGPDFSNLRLKLISKQQLFILAIALYSRDQADLLVTTKAPAAFAAAVDGELQNYPVLPVLSHSGYLT